MEAATMKEPFQLQKELGIGLKHIWAWDQKLGFKTHPAAPLLWP